MEEGARRKSTVNDKMELELFLKDVVLFSSIPESRLKLLASCFSVQQMAKDKIVFGQGERSDALYIIRSGTVIVSAENHGQTSFMVELRRGDFFGEMALLSDLPRSASARVSLDATLYCLKKDDFEALLTQHRDIGLFLSRLYARRLSTEPSTLQPAPERTFYSVSSTDPDLGLSHFLYSMAYHIVTESEKKVLVVEPHLEMAKIMHKFDLFPAPCPDESMFDVLPPDLYTSRNIRWFSHSAGFSVLQTQKGFHQKLVDVLPTLMESFKQLYDVVVFSLTHHFGTLERQAIRLCDKNLLIINNTPEALPGVKKKLADMERVAGIGLDRIRVGVSHLCGSIGIPRATLREELNLSETPLIWVEKSDKSIKNQIDTEKCFPVRGARAIARELAGVRVGLALGAGAARGWSHVGVLKVLEEEGIHIDMIAGTSMGALVGAVYASRGDVNHLIHQTIDPFPSRIQARKKIFDLTFPWRGFLRGKKAMKLVADATDNADFMDLAIPTYIVSVDIVTGEEILLETGDVSKAVRASLSLPAVFTPFYHEGRWMVDGGLLNPVPVNILEQKGADKIIAVCVESPHGFAKNDAGRSPNIFQVIFRTMNIVHGSATSGFAQRADVVIYPKVNTFGWDDFHKGHELMARGEEACRKMIQEIKGHL